MKVTSNDILKVSLGIATVVIALSVFNFSITRASAAPPEPQEFIQAGTDKIGKYQMSMSVATNDDKTMWAVIVWDTETGQSRTYYDNTNMSFGPSFNIPRSSPAGN